MMILKGKGVIVSFGNFTTKNGKEMKLVSIGEKESFTKFNYIGAGDLVVPEKNTEVEYTINLSQNNKYTNVFLVDLEEIN